MRLVSGRLAVVDGRLGACRLTPRRGSAMPGQERGTPTVSTATQSGEQPANTATGTPLLEVDGLRIQYGGVVAIDDISFTIPQGAIVGLIGPNGAGKTSLVDGLMGAHRPSGGHVRFDGVDVTGHSAHRLARRGMTTDLPVGRALR